METTAVFTINVIGETTGKPYSGKFTIKTVLTRGDWFKADAQRRALLGANAQEAMPMLQLEAFMLGKLSVQILDAPDWWKNSNNGLELEDANVITSIFEIVKQKEDEAKEVLKKQAEEALNALKNK